jgi:hypothetical protein
LECQFLILIVIGCMHLKWNKTRQRNLLLKPKIYIFSCNVIT